MAIQQETVCNSSDTNASPDRHSDSDVLMALVVMWDSVHYALMVPKIMK